MPISQITASSIANNTIGTGQIAPNSVIAAQISSVNAGVIAGQISANQISSVSNTAIIGTTLPGPGGITATMLDGASANGTGALQLPSGSGAVRPSGQGGQLRYSTTLGVTEQYTSVGWASITANPTITLFSYANPGQTAANTGETLGITGVGFKPGVTTKFIAANGYVYVSGSTSYANSTNITTVVPTLSGANGSSYQVQVVNSDGGLYTLATPLFVYDPSAQFISPAAGASLGTFVGQNPIANGQIKISVYDAFNISSVSISSGALPSGLNIYLSSNTTNYPTLNIAGTPANPATNTSTTYSFTVQVLDGNQEPGTRNYTLTINPGYTPNNSIVLGTY